MTSFQVIDPISIGTGVAKTTLGTVNKPSESQNLIEFTPFQCPTTTTTVESVLSETAIESQSVIDILPKRVINAPIQAGLGATYGTMLPTAPQTINPAGVVNKWTNAGLIGLGYKVIGSQINKTTGMSLIPETSKIGSIGKSVLIGGALGGFFDDAPAKAQTFTRQSFPTTNRALTTTYNSGQDSTGSSF